MQLNEGHAALAQMAIAFFLGVLASRGTDVFKIKVTTTFGNLVAAWFVGFVLAHFAMKYLDRLDGRDGFSPLIGPTPQGLMLPYGARGRDYIPHRFRPTAPPGPPSPAEYDGGWGAAGFDTAPPVAAPALALKGSVVTKIPRPSNAVLPSVTRAPWTPPPTGASTTFEPSQRVMLPYEMAELDSD